MPDIIKTDDTQVISTTMPWDNVDDVLEVLHKMKTGEWTWGRNGACKYFNIRIDTRDMKCVISDRNNTRITLEELKKQSK